MNRRDLMKRIVGVSALAGIEAPVQASTVGSESKPALAVLESAGRISGEMATRIVTLWDEKLKGTPFEGVTLMVLDDGMKLTFLDANGRILNERLEPDSVTIRREAEIPAAEFCPQCASVSCKLQDSGEDWHRVDEALQKLSAEPLTGGHVLPDYNAGVTWGKP